jgi:hypothetical protein
MHSKASILSTLESSRSVGSPKLFFHDPTSAPPQYTGSKRKQSNSDTNKLVFGDIFFSQSAKESEGKAEHVTSEKSNDQICNVPASSTTAISCEPVASVTPTLSEKVSPTMALDEAQSILNETDIDKIFEVYNATASQLLTMGFEEISRPYDAAIRLNKELEQFQHNMDSDLLHLGKRRRESSEAVEKLR